MTQTRCPVLFVAGVLPALAGTASANPDALAAQQSDIVRITAHIQDVETRADLAGAVIALSGVVDRHVTGVDGRVSFDAAVGQYTLTIRKGGYATIQGDFRVGPNWRR